MKGKNLMWHLLPSFIREGQRRLPNTSNLHQRLKRPNQGQSLKSETCVPVICPIGSNRLIQGSELHLPKALSNTRQAQRCTSHRTSQTSQAQPKKRLKKETQSHHEATRISQSHKPLGSSGLWGLGVYYGRCMHRTA